MSEAGPPEQPAVRILSQVGMPGFQFGLRHPSIAINLRLAPPPGNEQPALVQSLLVEGLSKQGFESTAMNWAAGSTASFNWTSIIMHWALQLQQAARLPIFERSKIIYVSPQGDNAIGVYGCLPRTFKPAVSAMGWLVQLFNARTEEGIAGLLRFLPRVIEALESERVPPLTYSFLRAAHELELPTLNLAENLFQFGYGARGRRLYLSGTDETSSISAYFARNKLFSSQIMRQFGIPTPVHEMAGTEAEAVAAAERIGYPVVVKPSDLDRGIGVATDLQTADAVRSAFVEASKHSTRILVEKFVEGDDHRLAIFRGELVQAIRRVPGGVTGDGTNSIAALVDLANADPRRGTSIHKPWRLLTFDEEALTLLQRSGRSPESVPQAGEFVRLRYTGNIARGGTPVNVLDTVHPDNRWLAQRAAAALHLDVCGVDLITPDITRSWRETGGAICEVNAGPDLGQVISPHLFAFMLQKLVPQNGRIPIAVVFGAGHDSPIVANIVERLTAAGLTVGRADRTGVLVGGEHVADGPLSAYDAGRMLLFDQNVEAVVLGVDAVDVLRSGLPVERYDVLVLAGSDPGAPGPADPVSRSRLLDNAFKTIVMGCTGPVLRAADAAMIPRQGAYSAERSVPLGPDALVEGAVVVLRQRVAELNAVIPESASETSGSGRLLGQA